MLSFLRHLGPVRCDEVRSLHLEDVLVQAPLFCQSTLDRLRSQRTYSEDVLARFATSCRNTIHPDTERAVQLLNKSGNIRKIYLNMRPSETLEYIKLCTHVNGFKNSEIIFESPNHWSVMPPSTNWETRSWYTKFLGDMVGKQSHDKRYYAYWLGDEKYRVEVDVFPALPQGRSSSTEYDCLVDGGGSSMDTAMEGLNLS